MSTLFSLRDWPSYVWLLLIFCSASAVAYVVMKRSERLRQQEVVLSAVAQLTPDAQMIVELLQNQAASDFTPLVFEKVETLQEADLTGFEVISDSRVFDLRKWNDPDSKFPSRATGYNRTRVRRLAEVENSSDFKLQRDMSTEDYLLDCKSERLDPRLYRAEQGEGLYRWELQLDFSRVPLDSYADIVSQSILPSEMARDDANGGRLNFSVRTKTGLLQVWLLMPEDRTYGLFEVSSHPIDEPERSEIVVPAAAVRAGMGSVATFRLINPEPNRRYKCRWTWEKPTEQ